MGKFKKLGLEDLGGFVFSTNDNFEFQADSVNKETLPKKDQRLEAHFSKKGRNGKIVTLIKGFAGVDKDLQALAKMLKMKCGVGGSAKEGEIIIQGNFRDQIIDILKKEGYPVKRV